MRATALDKMRLCPWFVSMLVMLACVVATILLTGIVPQRIFAYDTFMFVGGGYRIEQGYVPYKDFYLIHGALTLIMIAGGMWVTGNSPLALPLAIAIPLIPVTLCAWRLSTYYLSKRIALLLTCYVMLLWSGTYPLHYFFMESSYAMLANRQGYVYIVILLITLLGARSFPNRKHPVFIGAVVGILLGLILIDKPNYGISAVFLILALLNLNIVPYLVSMIVGFTLTFSPFCFYLGFGGLANMVQFMELSAALRSKLIYEQGLLLIGLEIPFLTVLLLDILLNLRRKMDRGDTALFPIRTMSSFIETIQISFFYEFAVVIIGSISLEMGGYPIFDMFDVPTLSAYAIVLLARFESVKGLTIELFKQSRIVFGFVCLIAVPIINLFLGLIFPWISLTLDLHQHHVVLASKTFPMMIFDEPRGLEKVPDHNEGVQINDGLKLIRRHPELDNVPIATLYFADAFSYCLNKPAPPHFPLFLNLGADVSKDIHPPADLIFTDCGAVMVCLTPQNYELDIVNGIPEYQQYLANHYVLTDQSQNWALWVKRP